MPLCLIATAQVGSYRNDVAVGVSGGYQLNSVSFVPKVQQGMLGGLNFGLTGRYTCEKYFNTICAVQVEINYAQLGWKEKILSVDDEPCVLSTNGEAAAFRRTVGYIQMPLLAHLGFGREVRGAKFFLNLGPQFGFKISDKVDTNFDMNSAFATTPERVSQVVAQDTMDVEKAFDYGITAGVGLEYSIPKAGHFLIEARYYYGLGNIYGDTKADYFSRSNHTSIVIKATYLFDLVRTKGAKRK